MYFTSHQNGACLGVAGLWFGFFIPPFVVGEADGKKPTEVEVSRFLMVSGRRLRNPSLRTACRFGMLDHPMGAA